MTPQALMLFVMLAPLLGGLFCDAVDRWRDVREAASLIVGLAVLAASLLCAGETLAGVQPGLGLELGGGLTAVWRLDHLAGFACATLAAVTLLVRLFALGQPRRPSIIAGASASGLALGAAFSVVFSANAFTLALSMMTLMLGLARLGASPQAVRDARSNVWRVTAAGCALLTPALALAHGLAGGALFASGGHLPANSGPVTVSAILTLSVFGVAVLCVAPLSAWPASVLRRATPEAAAFGVAGIAAIAGPVALLRVIAEVVGPGFTLTAPVTPVLLGLAGASAALSAGFAVAARDLAGRVGHLAAAHMALAAFAALMATPAGLDAGVLLALVQPWALALLIMAAAELGPSGSVLRATLEGAARRHVLAATGIVIAALSLVGFPPFAGLWAKLLLTQGAVATPQPWIAAAPVAASALAAFAVAGIVAASLRTPADPAHVRPSPPNLAVTIAIATPMPILVLWFFFAEGAIRAIALGRIEAG
jgi:multicomponent Na+:H+ antiporter subunit D